MDENFSNYEYEEDKVDEDEDEDSEIDYGNYEEDDEELEELSLLKNEIKDKDSDLKPDEKQNIEEAFEETGLEKDDEDEDDYDDNIDDNSSLDENDLELNFKNNKKPKILKYKEENVKNFSALGMISYLCNLVDYIKNGNTILDGKTEFDYPNETEESYAIESILLDTNPFIYIIKNKKIQISQINKMLCLKLVLRCVDENKSIFFTKLFVEKFPVFIKCLHNNYITQEELDEIDNVKKKYNLKISSN